MRTSIITGLQVSIRAGAAAAISVAAAEALGLDYPIYALIASIIIIDLSPARTRQLGLQRLAGTIIGAALGAATSVAGSYLTHVGPLAIAVGVLAAILVTDLLGLKDAAKLAGYVAGIVLLEHHDRPWLYAFYRLVETVLGIVAAFTVSVIPKLLKVEDLNQESLRNDRAQDQE